MIFPSRPTDLADLDLENCGLQPSSARSWRRIGDPGEPALHFYSDPMRCSSTSPRTTGGRRRGFAKLAMFGQGPARALERFERAARRAASGRFRRARRPGGEERAPALLLRQRDGRRRPFFPDPDRHKILRHARLPRGELDVPRALHAGQRHLPRLRARGARERLGDAQAEGRDRRADQGLARRSRSAAARCASTSRSARILVRAARVGGVELDDGDARDRAGGGVEPRRHATSAGLIDERLLAGRSCAGRGDRPSGRLLPDPLRADASSPSSPARRAAQRRRGTARRHPFGTAPSSCSELGRVPPPGGADRPCVGMQIPSVLDRPRPARAPRGHVFAMYSRAAPREEQVRLKDEFAERIVDR